jgi:Domain of unknown function (DUF4349)
MKTRNVVLILLVLVCLVACSRKESQEAKRAGESQANAPIAEKPLAYSKVAQPAEYAKDIKSLGYNKSENKPAKKLQQEGQTAPFSGHFYIPMKYENERKLEYTITISYETENFQESRMALLEIVSKYGFLLDSRTAIYQYPFLSANIKIKTEHLYQALKEFERIGSLTAENIQANDLTEKIMITNKMYERQQERSQRRQEAVKEGEKKYVNWDSQEYDLIQQENQMDDLAMQQWRFEDRLIWASVHVEIKGPVLPAKAEKVEVPQFKQALNHVLRTFLVIAYGIVWALPYIIIIILIIVIWKKWQR